LKHRLYFSKLSLNKVLTLLSRHSHFLARTISQSRLFLEEREAAFSGRTRAGRDLNSRRRIKNYENPRARRDVYTCRPGLQEFSATRVDGGNDGGGGQIKLRREIYGRACNEQLFHGMRTPGLASGGGISIRSSSCRPRASRSLSAPIRVALPWVLFRAKRKTSRLRRCRRCLWFDPDDVLSRDAFVRDLWSLNRDSAI